VWNILQGGVLYDNARQLIFMIPAWFVFCGLGLEWIMSAVRRPHMFEAVVVLLLIPGLVAIVALHPYEYVYYNALVGWTRGANGRFELDYWCLSSREAIERVNAVADEGAVVETNKGTDQIAPLARSDLVVLPYAPGDTPDYLILCRRLSRDVGVPPGMELFGRVERQGAPLAEIWTRNSRTH